jgi:hypothetical protein
LETIEGCAVTFVETPFAVSAVESPIAKRGSKFSLGS